MYGINFLLWKSVLQKKGIFLHLAPCRLKMRCGSWICLWTLLLDCWHTKWSLQASPPFPVKICSSTNAPCNKLPRVTDFTTELHGCCYLVDGGFSMGRGGLNFSGKLLLFQQGSCKAYLNIEFFRTFSVTSHGLFNPICHL